MGKILRTWTGALVFCAALLIGFAAGKMDAYAQTSGDYEYTELGGGTVEITKYSGTEANPVLPDTLDGKPVSSIGKQAFFRCKSITGVTIPSSVTTIGEQAFKECEGLTSVTVPVGVKEIGYQAFALCSSLGSVTLPSGLQSIGYEAFNNCAFKNIVIPNSVTKIAQGTFMRCKNLESIVVPDSVTEIGANAFSLCSGLKSIQLPKNLKSISWDMFSFCTSLSGITIPKSVTKLDTDAFYGCTSLKSVVIPAGVTEIGRSAFEQCSGLSAVTVPDSVRYIREFAFKDCSGLKNVKYTGTDEQWKYVSIEEGNEALANAAFQCRITVKAENVSLPKTVVYNGKAQKPSITVKVKGKKVSKSSYTVKWKNNKKIGTASVTLTFKGDYAGEVTKSFDIVPKGTEITKLTAQKRGFTVKWKKGKKPVGSYFIEYATNKQFKNRMFRKLTNANTTTLKIKGLKAGKKYYVRIQTYNSGRPRRLSAWSKVKIVTTNKVLELNAKRVE